MATTKNFPVFDCDSHVVEPPLIWEEYVSAAVRSWVKTQFCCHTDGELLMINGRMVLAARPDLAAALAAGRHASRFSARPAVTA